jgi:hypothetical protein
MASTMRSTTEQQPNRKTGYKTCLSQIDSLRHQSIPRTLHMQPHSPVTTPSLHTLLTTLCCGQLDSFASFQAFRWEVFTSTRLQNSDQRTALPLTSPFTNKPEFHTTLPPRNQWRKNEDVGKDRLSCKVWFNRRRNLRFYTTVALTLRIRLTRRVLCLVSVQTISSSLGHLGKQLPAMKPIIRLQLRRCRIPGLSLRGEHGS